MQPVSRRPPKLLPPLLLAALLAGCGNAIDRFDIGRWQPAGEPGPARYPRGDAVPAGGSWLQALEPGSGREVALGDAVALEAVVTRTDRQGVVTASPPMRLWLYTGFEGRLESWGDERGWLGDPALRARLVGLREGATLQVAASGEGAHEVVVPTRLFHARLAARLPGIEAGPELTLASRAQGAGGAQVEARLRLLETCPATLFQRTSVVTQWGLVILPGSGKDHPNSRRGELYWGGLRADCPARAAPLWFQSGPGVGAGLRGGNAFDIERSFETGHPRLLHAEDWRGDVAEAGLPAELRGAPRRSP